MPDHDKKFDRQPESPGLNRRLFISAAAAGAAGIGMSMRQSASAAPKSAGRSGRIRWRFEARRVEQSFLDGSTVPFFRYVSVGNTRSNGNLPLMQDFENRDVSVSINNQVDFPVQPTIYDYATGPVIIPGETGIWEFSMPPEGTWMFGEALLGTAASSAGFAAAMISNPATIRKAQRDYYLLYQDADDRWNEAIDNGEVPDETVFEPNFHTLNGLTYPQTMEDKSTRIRCRIGEDLLIRIANLGNIRHSIHFHGYHAQIIKKNNKPDDTFPPKDTFALPAYSTLELIVHIDQVGEFPIHPHSLTATTDNGVYAGGSLGLIDAESQ